MSVAVTEITLAVIFLSVKHINNRCGYFRCLEGSRSVSKGMITNVQIRAARALLDWKQTDLAKAAKVSEMSVKNLEKGDKDPRVSTIQAVRAALEAAGVEFINDDRGDGVVKLRDQQN